MKHFTSVYKELLKKPISNTNKIIHQLPINAELQLLLSLLSEINWFVPMLAMPEQCYAEMARH
jgi:hypothetical protein